MSPQVGQGEGMVLLLVVRVERVERVEMVDVQFPDVGLGVVRMGCTQAVGQPVG